MGVGPGVQHGALPDLPATVNITVVLPTNRPRDCSEFLAAWEPQLRDGAGVIVMEDGPQRSMDLPPWVRHVSHRQVTAMLGDNARIIPQGSSACRSFGTLLAQRTGAEVIWHLDDDCRPEPDVSYLDAITGLLAANADPAQWWNTLTGVYPRGYPYNIRRQQRPVMIHHGLWSHVPDLDGRTQLAMPDLRLPPATRTDVVPYGAMFPMCGMNLAFSPAAAPLMYMGLQGGGYPFDRFDDMWAGLFAKRICDHLGWAVTSGAPSVRHDRASDPERNALIEAPGIEAHEHLWPVIAAAKLTETTAAGCYAEMADVVAGFRTDGYWQELAAAMHAWAELTA